MNRLVSLDWLRGLLACAIMFYHLTGWEYGPRDASTVLGRLGIYGVSMFFILSGLSLSLAYSMRLTSWPSVAGFYVRRVFRILPMLWLVVAASQWLAVSMGTPHSSFKILMNVSGLFGFVDTGLYINTGAWSIGNEIVYYSLTPIILLIFEKSRRWGKCRMDCQCGGGFIFCQFCHRCILVSGRSVA